MKLAASLVLALLLPAIPARAADDPDISRLMPQIEAIVKDIDRFLLELAGTNNAAIITVNLVKVIRTYPFADFRWLENRFRLHGTSIHLVAQPKKFLPENACAGALWPFTPPPEFTLWVGLFGRDEMLRQLKIFGIESEQQNLENLMRTGIMTLKDPATRAQ